jgi:Domain of unknown function (DUF5118)
MMLNHCFPYLESLTKTNNMQFSFHRFFILCVTLSLSVAAVAQPAAGSRPDTSRRPLSPPAPQGPKPYKEIITSKAVSDGGLFWVHRIEDKYYFEIPDSLFYRDILVVNRLSKAGAGMRVGGFAGYAGDDVSRNVFLNTVRIQLLRCLQQ